VIVIMLGDFEYLTLTAAMRLGENAYRAATRQEIAIRHRCSIGALPRPWIVWRRRASSRRGWGIRRRNEVAAV
jgi:hypothetical protein